jgi:DNA-binding beta-propeller fold protein YncE
VAVTPNGKTAFVTNSLAGTVAAVDVKTRTNEPHGRRAALGLLDVVAH